MQPICSYNFSSYCAELGTRFITEANAQNSLHTFPRNFPVDWEVANLLRTC